MFLKSSFKKHGMHGSPHFYYFILFSSANEMNIKKNKQQRLKEPKYTITMGHSNFHEPTLTLMMTINVGHTRFQPTMLFW